MPIVDRITIIISFVQRVLSFLKRGTRLFCGRSRKKFAEQIEGTRENRPLLQQHGIQEQTQTHVPLYLRGLQEAKDEQGGVAGTEGESFGSRERD